ncbi:MAG: class C beta-lactamase-related serine hydrolase [Gemmatimonadetes bacterium]|nr:MAG: class C beta-lactamase-related serine hydrolase [Gemmatimonadota bacterium]
MSARPGVRLAALCLAAVLCGPLAVTAQTAYVPPRGEEWQRLTPAQAGFDPARLDAAVRFAQEQENPAPRDLEAAHHLSFGREPYGAPVGPFRTRGGSAGLVIRGGYIVAEWGDTRRVDMTFSVSKSFLSTVVGLAWDRGLIRDLDDPVALYMPPMELPPGDGEPGIDRGDGRPEPVTLFENEHNRTITWDHLLRQTSDWEGTLWGKPDWADRPGRDVQANKEREHAPPGTTWKYNDVRVNLLALAALQVWRRPLPAVLRDLVMDPIGASNTWRWHGYDNSWLNVDGRQVQSVSGGGHWGGGMFISARDQARFGLFTLRRGAWGDQRLLDEGWFDLATTPTGPQPGYGFMNYFLNRPDADGRKRYPSAPDEAYAHLGNGTNMVYVDPVHDLVIVARWIQPQAIDAVLGQVIGAIVGDLATEGS